jgi:hypothetical protein
MARQLRIGHILVALVAFALIVVFAECGKKADTSKQQGTTEQQQAAAEGTLQEDTAMTGEQAEGESGKTEPKPVAPVNFKKLQEYLPKQIAGCAAGEPEGATATFGKFSFSSTDVTFTKDENTRIKVSIFDYAYVPELYMGFKMWLDGNYNVEDSHGYQKSVKVEGVPGLEVFQKENKRSELTILVGNRFIVQATGENITDMNVLRSVLKQIDLAGLAKVTS